MPKPCSHDYRQLIKFALAMVNLSKEEKHTMSKRSFTEEELQILRSNPFTLKVTDRQVSFTREFKELFINEYNKGLTSRQIVTKYG